MRWAKSYSIIDHQILQSGYLYRLSHESMVLYLFLVVVGDKEGKSYYADTSIMNIVRMNEEQFSTAKMELQKEGLIKYKKPYWWVRTISNGGNAYERRRTQTKNTVS